MGENLDTSDQLLPDVGSFDSMSGGYQPTTSDVTTDDGQYVVLGECDPRNDAVPEATASSTDIAMSTYQTDSRPGMEHLDFSSDQFMDDDISDLYSSFSENPTAFTSDDSGSGYSTSHFIYASEANDATTITNTSNEPTSDQELYDPDAVVDQYTTSNDDPDSILSTQPEHAMFTVATSDSSTTSSDQHLVDDMVTAVTSPYNASNVYQESISNYNYVPHESMSDTSTVTLVNENDTAASVLIIAEDNSVQFTVTETNVNTDVIRDNDQPLFPNNSHSSDTDHSNYNRPAQPEEHRSPPGSSSLPASTPEQVGGVEAIVQWFDDLWTSFSDYVEDVWTAWTAPLGSESSSPYTTYSGSDSDAVAGEPLQSMDHWELQSKPDTCAVVAQMMVIEELTGRDLTQEDVVRVAENAGVYAEGMGTPQELLGGVIEAYGLEAETINHASISDIESHLNSGEKMVVAVRADDYWNPEAGSMDEQLYKTLGLPDPGANHCVEVIGIDRSDPQHPQVIVNDSGHPDGRGMAIPMDQFEDAWANSGNFLVTAHA